MTSLTGGELDSGFRRNDSKGEKLATGNGEPFLIYVEPPSFPRKRESRPSDLEC